jgi:hypothetical protein
MAARTESLQATPPVRRSLPQVVGFRRFTDDSTAYSASALAQHLIVEPSVEAVSRGITQMPCTASLSLQDDDEDPDEAPETPTDEPKPAPVQDPPAEPNQVPYVVRALTPAGIPNESRT